MKQQYTSEKTSINQIPRTHKYLATLGRGFKNFDNIVENCESLSHKGEYTSSTISNVLNTIKEKNIQLEVIQRSYDMLKDGGFCLITVYYKKGNKAGETSNGWQWHKPLKEYLPVVKEVFNDVEIKDNIIIARK